MSRAAKLFARCMRCSASFTEAELEGHSRCPKCASKGVPMSPSQDVTVRVNVHELRVLGIWAEHYASRADHAQLDNAAHEPLVETVHLICDRLEAQLREKDKWMPLTMAGELKQLREALPDSDIVMYRDGHEEVDT